MFGAKRGLQHPSEKGPTLRIWIHRLAVQVGSFSIGLKILKLITLFHLSKDFK